MNKKNIKEDTSKKDTTTLRIMNWVFSFALIFGSLMMIFKASQTGTLYLLLFLIVTISAYTMTAILLYPGTSKIFGMPIVLDKTNKLLYKISLASNLLFLLLGVGIILSSVFTGQYILAILGFIFTLLSFANVKALDYSVKELEN